MLAGLLDGSNIQVSHFCVANIEIETFILPLHFDTEDSLNLSLVIKNKERGGRSEEAEERMRMCLGEEGAE